MELKMSVSEAVELIKEVKSLPSKIFEYIDTGVLKRQWVHFLQTLWIRNSPIT